MRRAQPTPDERQDLLASSRSRLSSSLATPAGTLAGLPLVIADQRTTPLRSVTVIPSDGAPFQLTILALSRSSLSAVSRRTAKPRLLSCATISSLVARASGS